MASATFPKAEHLVQAVKKLVPMFDRVLIQKAEAAPTTKGGIVIPEKGQKINRGTVVAIGPGRRNKNGEFIKPILQVGDTVLLPEYNGTKVELDEEKVLIMYKEHELLAKIES